MCYRHREEGAEGLEYSSSWIYFGNHVTNMIQTLFIYRIIQIYSPLALVQAPKPEKVGDQNNGSLIQAVGFTDCNGTMCRRRMLRNVLQFYKMATT